MLTRLPSPICRFYFLIFPPLVFILKSTDLTRQAMGAALKWSFYSKTYIIIPTCTYDLAQPPNHPTLIPNIFPQMSESTHSRCLDVRLADTHRQPRYRSPQLTNSCTSATSRQARGGREGVIICTGKYDNISFRIKTPY